MNQEQRNIVAAAKGLQSEINAMGLGAKGRGDHVVMGAYGFFAVCLHCGESFPSPPPMKLTLFLSQLKKIVDDHADCQPAANSQFGKTESEREGVGMGWARKRDAPLIFSPAIAPAPTVAPVLAELIALLPEPHTVWPYEEREKWLAAASALFKVVYTYPPKQGGG